MSETPLLLAAAKQQHVPAAPIWIMRQAGRYLPEFMEVRKSYDFFGMCQTPKVACEITMQPIRRYPLDAAIIFSDILVIPQALGMELKMVEAKGPVFPQPLVTPADMQKLEQNASMKEKLEYVMKAISLTRAELPASVPLYGFAGGPWTLMAYMIEGGGSKTFSKAKKWLFIHPKESHELLKLLTKMIIEFLIAQADAGAQILQVFESWSGELSPSDFEEFLLPYLKEICAGVKSRHPSIPMAVFPKGAAYSLKMLNKSGYDVIGIDWTVSPAWAREQAPDVTLQGNLDPCVLYADRATIRRYTYRMLQEFGGYQKLIVNLGHGMHPDHPVQGVADYIAAVKDFCAGVAE